MCPLTLHLFGVQGKNEGRTQGSRMASHPSDQRPWTSSLSFAPNWVNASRDVCSGRIFSLSRGLGGPSKVALHQNLLLEQEGTLKGIGHAF